MELVEDTLRHLVSEIKDYQLTHGSLLKFVRFEQPTTVAARPVNASILPTQFPKRLFDEAISLQPAFNDLYMSVACNPEWLICVLLPLLHHDPFFTALWNIHLAVKDAGVVQDVVCGIFRSDYMVHREPSQPDCLKQVEMNTFSLAGASHAETIAKMHRHLRQVHGVGKPGAHQADLPRNANISSLVSALRQAHAAYKPTTKKRTCVLMIVQPFNFNIADERPIEYGLWDGDIPCYRCEWPSILETTAIGEDRVLLFQPAGSATELEVSTIYYRAGYDAAEYDDRGTQARLRLELSRAIKCPDVLTHLTAFKAVQAALSRSAAGNGESGVEVPPAIAKTFMPMHTLDAIENLGLAIDPELVKNYVLKPNLEGGGHNVFREDILEFMDSVPEAGWPGYSLMRLIEPPVTRGILLTSEELYQGEVISELGVLGTCLWRRTASGPHILSNGVAGWTFKSKPAEVDEMSVVKGYGCFDCPALVDDNDTRDAEAPESLQS